jgi:diguanylate cyclase (GGDEF)-like protein
MASSPLLSDVIAYQTAHHEFKAPGDLPLIQSTGLSNAAFTYERERPNGRILEIECIPLLSGGMVQTFTDITERRMSEQKLRYFAHHDDLTKLVNRVVFRERLSHAIERADRSNCSIAVLYLDLDRFKQVNDTMGHSAGDQLLVEAAERLSGAVRDIDTVARMGGDEFAIIQPLIDNAEAATALAGRVTRLLNKPFNIKGISCNVGVSVGIALYPQHAATGSELLRNADTALNRAKTDGRNHYRVFEPAMDIRQQQMLALERDLRQAVELQQFELDYQPIVHSDTRLALHCEALVRWRHPARGLVPPGEFIELAESSRLIIPIGLWVLETACAEAMHWPGHVAVAVNLSPAQFNDEGLGEAVRAVLERTGLAPHRLVLEITEGLLLEETSVVMATMLQIRRLGVQFSLDDFGTAHAGLSYLQRFPFESIKIDKSFVRNTADRKGAQAIIKGVLGIATALNLRVIAEGVETEEQLDKLKNMNCKYIQGYLTGRPMASAAIRAFVARAS